MVWNEETKKYIDTITGQMELLGVLEDADRANLTLLGDAHHLYTIAKEELDRNGLTVTDQKGRMVANPAFSVLRSQQSVMVALFKELSISTRQRRLLTKDAIVNEETPLGQLFGMLNE